MTEVNSIYGGRLQKAAICVFNDAKSFIDVSDEMPSIQNDYDEQ